MKTGITSSWKLTGGVTVVPLTVTGTLTDLPSYCTVRLVCPSAAGKTVEPCTRMSLSSAGWTWALPVTSSVIPSGRVARTTNRCRARLVLSRTSGG
jgi:hypothetical protein